MSRATLQNRSFLSTKKTLRSLSQRLGSRAGLLEGLESRVLMSAAPIGGGAVKDHVKGAITPVVDHAPTESWTGQIAGIAKQGGSLAINYSAVVAASHAKDADGDKISFTIETVSDAGALTITHNGSTSAVVAGTTTFSDGDSLAWSPAAGHAGNRYAFSVLASDGTLAAVNQSALFATVAELPKVTAFAMDPFAFEALAGKAAGNGEIVVTRSGDATLPLKVNLGVGGTAVMGANYTLIAPDGSTISSSTPSVTFAAHQTSLKLKISPVQDNTVDPTLTVTVTVLADSSATPAYKADAHVAKVNIIDGSPTVKIDAECGDASSSKPGKIVVSRTSDGTSALTVNFTTAAGTGFGTQGTDYVLKDSSGTVLTNSITLAAGQKCAVISVFAVDDGAKGKLKAKLTLATGSSYKVDHGCDNTASVRLIIGSSITTPPPTTTTPPTQPVTPTINNGTIFTSIVSGTSLSLTFAQLVTMTGAALGSGDPGPLQLEISDEVAGVVRIQHGSSAAVGANIGDLVSAGDTLTWTPPIGAISSGIEAFSLVAQSGTLDSSGTADFSVAVTS